MTATVHKLESARREGLGDCLRHRSGGLRPEPVVSALRAPAAIAGPSPDFIRRGRNPDLEPPSRFEPTVKRDGDVVL